MKLLGVEHLADREFGTLSSGERRRILIARALVHDPEVLVLDEPSTALDFAAALQLTATLRSLLEKGRDLVLVTHHPGEIPAGNPTHRPPAKRPDLCGWKQEGHPHLRPPERALSSGSARLLEQRLVRRPACLACRLPKNHSSLKICNHSAIHDSALNLSVRTKQDITPESNSSPRRALP